MVDLFSYMDEERREVKEPPKKKSPLTVTQLTKQLKVVIESSLKNIFVEGEISNYKKHTSGHHYFSIKDQNCVINCVMWRSVRVDRSLVLENGKKVNIYGNLTIFEAGGRYQIDVKRIELTGIGELALKFEELKRVLDAEGLFDRDRKRRIGSFNREIGVVTAATGAAFQDIKKVIRSRAPFVNITLYNARVQGDGAREEIVKGIELLNRYLPHLDLIIVGRGGGSLEDLWCFNEEVVARAIFNSKIPVISAVGHEIDFSISDFTADLRAATPSHAAEIATISRDDQLRSLTQLSTRLEYSVLSRLKGEKDRLTLLENSNLFRAPSEMVNNHLMVLDLVEDRMERVISTRLKSEGERVDNFQKLLNSLSHKSILKRGYSIVKKGDKYINSVNMIEVGDSVDIEHHDGTYSAVVDNS